MLKEIVTPKISIVVPVYKAEAYLRRCIDSLLNQYYQDYEVLLIDDGSPDKSGEICEEYARLNNKIRVFHKKNGGVSSARNLGIFHAKGEWITFVDSDDCVGESFLGDFGLNKFDSDIYIQGYQVERGGSLIERHAFSVGKISILSFNECFIQGERANILNSPVCKLFKIDIIKKYSLSFDINLSYGEDHIFVLSYLCRIRLITVSPASTYVYVHHKNESLTRRVIPFQEILSYARKVNQLQFEVLNKWQCDDESVYAMYWRTYSNMIIAIENFFRSDEMNREDFQMIRSTYKSLVSPSV